MEHKPSYEITTSPETGPLKEELNALCNDLHEAFREGDLRKQERITQEAPVILEAYEVEEAPTTANPEWSIRTMRGAFKFAQGHFELALEYDKDAWARAIDPQQAYRSSAMRERHKAISANNIGEALRNLGRPEEAFLWNHRAIECWPTNPIVHMNTAMTCYALDLKDRTQEIASRICDLLDLVHPDDTSDAIACLAYEDALHDMKDVPAVGSLLEKLKSFIGVDESLKGQRS